MTDLHIPADTQRAPISRTKLEAFLKSCHTNTADIEETPQYFYCAGRNILADVLLVEIAMGNMDDEMFQNGKVKEG